MDQGPRLRGPWMPGQGDRFGPHALPQAYAPTLDPHQLAKIEFESIPGTTHLLPLEAPGECAAAVLAYLGRRGLLDSAQGSS